MTIETRGVLRLAMGLVVAGCAAGKGTSSQVRVDRDGGDAAVSAFDAAPRTPPGAAPPYLLAALDHAGQVVGGATLEVRVEWPAPAAALLTSPGIDGCNEPRRPALRVHTLHGVPGVVVHLDPVTRGRSPDPIATVALEVGDCRIEPAVALAARLGAPIAVTSLSERRQQVVVDYLGDQVDRVAAIDLPLIGQQYRLSGDRPGIYRFAVATEATSPSYVVVPDHPYFAVTDATGRAVFHQVVPGDYQVVAWHPPLADGAAPTATQPVTLGAAERAQLTLSLGP